MISKKLYDLLENVHSKYYIRVNFLIYTLIFLNLIAVSLESVEEIRANYANLLAAIEHVTMFLFAIEYALRLIAAKHTTVFKQKGIFGYITSTSHIIDFVALVPYYVSFFGFNSSFFRGLRLLRVFKLLHMNKLSKFDDLLKKIISQKKDEFIFLFSFIFIVLTILSFLVYHFEHEVQPEVYTSIPQTMWWAIVTLASVGYGDMYPITEVGKILSSTFMFMGIAFIAIPSAIFASSFIEEFEKKRDHDRRLKCAMCGSQDIEIREINLKSEQDEVFHTSMHACNKCGHRWGTFT